MARSISTVRSPRQHDISNIRLERLEQRAMFSAASISYSNFSSTANLTANGFGSTAPTSNGQLVMTDSQLNEARSVFYNTPVPFDHFTTHFTYRPDAGAAADGFAFALQEGGPTEVGAIGGSLGYQNITGNHAGVGFEMYYGDYSVFSGDNPVISTSNNNIGNPNGPQFINLQNNDTYQFTISYDGTNLTTTIVDETNSANSFTESDPIDLTSVLGANTAYVGFTAATGSSVSTQRIANWDYSGNDGLTITTPAAASSGPITGTSTPLSVTATDTSSNGGALTYAWSLLHKPSGATNPTFDENNSTTAGNTTAHFGKAGTYVFAATATDANGLTDTSDVTVIVHQTATAIRIIPHAQKISRKASQTNTATITDQFGHPMRMQPTIAWSLVQGSGSIDASSGVFTAGVKKGHVVIEASDALDGLTGTIGATVV